METEKVQKLDELFGEVRKTESLNAEEVFSLVGSLLRKTATDETLTIDTIKLNVQKANELLSVAQKWATNKADNAPETVSVPVDLLSFVRKASEGEDASIITVSEAINVVSKRLGVEKKADLKPSEKPVQKSASDVQAFTTDTIEAKPEDAGHDWGKDPDWTSR